MLKEDTLGPLTVAYGRDFGPLLNYDEDGTPFNLYGRKCMVRFTAESILISGQTQFAEFIRTLRLAKDIHPYAAKWDDELLVKFTGKSRKIPLCAEGQTVPLVDLETLQDSYKAITAAAGA